MNIWRVMSLAAVEGERAPKTFPHHYVLIFPNTIQIDHSCVTLPRRDPA